MRVLVLALAILMAGTGCAAGGVGVEYDADLNDRIVNLATTLNRDGGSVKLADLVDGVEWDTVYVYAEWTSAKEIERDLGEPVVPDDGYFSKGNLLVFVDDGEVVKALEGVPLYDAGGSKWSRDVRIEPTGKAGLRLAE